MDKDSIQAIYCISFLKITNKYRTELLLFDSKFHIKLTNKKIKKLNILCPSEVELFLKYFLRWFY